MALLVQKFGGTSLGSISRIEAAADIVKKSYDLGNDIVVVVSAMAGETDKLLSLASQISNHPVLRELDVLLSTGEQVSIALMTMALIKRGLKAKSYTGSQVYILTDNKYTKASIVNIQTEHLKEDLKSGNVVVVAGFQGIDQDGNITTFGRGGSDITAVALAAALSSDECQIYTDVDGVYTTDPNIVPEAQLIESIGCNEMLELASAGSKVLQHRAVHFAKQYKVPVRVLSSFNPGEGTLVSFEDKKLERPVISGIACNRNEVRFTVSNMTHDAKVGARIIESLSECHIPIDMFMQNFQASDTMELTFTVHYEDNKKVLILLQDILADIKNTILSHDLDIAKISVVGLGMRSNAEVINTIFSTLTRNQISIKLFNSSETKVSVCVAEEDLEHAARLLHRVFALHEQEAVTGCL